MDLFLQDLLLCILPDAQKQHNFRVSYQTGFRNPTTQDQYIGLDLGPFALIGSAPDNLNAIMWKHSM